MQWREKLLAGISAKLEVGDVNDPLEREADAVADQVMRTPAPGPESITDLGPERESDSDAEELGMAPRVRRLSYAASSCGSVVQRQCAGCEAEKDEIRRSPVFGPEDGWSLSDNTVSRPYDFLPGRSRSLRSSTFGDGVIRGGEGDQRIMREPAAGQRGGATSGDSWAQLRGMVRSGGRPLSDSARNFLEPRLHADLGSLRVHDDRAADTLAGRINARAFTFGEDIFFRSGELRPSSDAGMRLLTHEVAHTLQAPSNSQAASTIRRTPAPGGCSAADLPKDQLTKHDGDERLAPFIDCPELVEKIPPEQIVKHGPQIASLLLERGHTDVARRLLARMTGNQIPSAWKRDIQITPESVKPNHANALIEQAVTAALDHNHGLAMELLAVAYGLVQIGLFQGSSILHQHPDHSYDFKDWQECLAMLFAIYPTLIRHNRRKGDSEQGKRYQAQWTKIRADLLNNHTIQETPVPKQIPGFASPARGANDIEPIVLGTANATVPEVKSDEYTQFAVRGTDPNSTTEVVSPMTREQSQARESTLTDTMSSVAKDVAGQQNFLTELDAYGNGAIRRAFPDRPPNLRDREERIQAWTSAYEALLPLETFAFRGLMDLIAKYLAVFTLHSSWNVTDSGKSYLSRDMPTDVAGRLLQDCGVYAMSVATEAFAAVKRSAKGKLSSEIFVLPAHVIMVLFHETAGDFYVVSNDEISGPFKGTPTEMGKVWGEISRAFAGVIGSEDDPVKDIVAPVGRVKMGATDEFSEQDFNERYWDRYSTMSQGYNAIEGAKFPDEHTRARRSSLEQYEIHMRQYRTDSATLMKAIAPMLGMSDKDLVKEESTILALLPGARRILDRFVEYGSSSARPDAQGGVVAPRGGISNEAQRAAALLETPPPHPSGNTPDPHVYFTKFQAHPLAYLRGLLDRFLVAKGTSADCSARATDLDRLVCNLRVVFPSP